MDDGGFAGGAFERLPLTYASGLQWEDCIDRLLGPGALLHRLRDDVARNVVCDVAWHYRLCLGLDEWI
jgi:hypothetical protein